ncbi:MAG: pyridoxal phosphate-dependent decarboxylase family protein [Terriglobales bacterium]
MTSDEFRRCGHQMIDWIADYRAGLAQRPVLAPTAPGEVRRRLPAAPPQQKEDWAALQGDLDAVILPALTHWQHPRFFAYFPGNAALASVLGDLAAAGLGTLGLAWQSCPALTELEEVVVDWLRQMVGLGAGWSGVLADTASTSTLVALLCARERATAFGLDHGGLRDAPRPLTVYTSVQSHSSVEKAALLAGFGREHLRLVACGPDFGMDPAALADALAEDAAGGRQPCAIVATAGTTGVTAFDPIAAAADLARPYGCWLHVDAAMAGAAMILPECRPLWEGVEAADSMVLNPHKWLGAVFDCSAYFVRDPQHLIRVMSTHPSYLQSAVDSQVKNYRDWGLPLGRRFRALKLWFLIREQGVEGLQTRLRRDLANAQWLAEQVRAAPAWRVVAPVPLQTVCVRHHPPALAGPDLDRHTRAWCDRINRSGRAFLTPALLDGSWMVRVSIGAETTERDDVAAVWQAMREAAEAEARSCGA